MMGLVGRAGVIGDVNAFIFEAKTTGADETFTLPIYSGGTYDFNVDWGDGSDDDITAWDDAAKVHTYASADTYTVTITGTINGWRFAGAGDCTKIYDISAWGPLLLGNGASYFQGCTNLTVTATDVLDLTGTTNFSYAFRDCSSLITLDVSAWDVSSVTIFYQTFYGCSSLTTLDVSSWNVSNVTDFAAAFQSCSSIAAFDVSSWNVSKVTRYIYTFYGCSSLTTLAASTWDITSTTDMTGMFTSVTLTTASYDAILIGWEAQNEKPNVTFDAGNSVMTLGGLAEDARDALVANGWTITDSTGVHT